MDFSSRAAEMFKILPSGHPMHDDQKHRGGPPKRLPLNLGTDVNDITGVYGIAIGARDLARTRAFYTGVLGFAEIDGIATYDSRPVVSFACAAPQASQVIVLSAFDDETDTGLVKDFAPSGAIVLASPPGGLAAWQRRLADHRVRITGRAWAFNQEHLCFTDPDGFDLAIVEDTAIGPANSSLSGAKDFVAMLRFKSVEIAAHSENQDIRNLFDVVGLPISARDGPVTRFQIGGGVPAGFVDILSDLRETAVPGSHGRIRHLVFRVLNHAVLARLAGELSSRGYRVSGSARTHEPVWIGLPRPGAFTVGLCSNELRAVADGDADEPV